MRILITNDDGINAIGIHKLAEMAKKLGEVWVVAPEGQCSAMSQKITVSDKIRLAKAPDFPVSGVKAYRLGGTPADCVKVAVEYLMTEKPDVVFSGINNGYNAGIEVSYSGTVAAAMEALLNCKRIGRAAGRGRKNLECKFSGMPRGRMQRSSL